MCQGDEPYIAESGWYIKVDNFEPWGPFNDPGEAAESIKIEWERFENPPEEWTSGKFKVTMSEEDPSLMSVEFGDETTVQLEEVFGVSADSPEFQVAFEKFVNDAIVGYLDKQIK